MVLTSQENDEESDKAIINSYPSEPSQSQTVETAEAEVQVGSPLYAHISRNKLAKVARQKEKLKRKLDTKKKGKIAKVQIVKKGCRNFRGSLMKFKFILTKL